MCRLYGLVATHPTRAACELIDAQNALIQQSREDQRGLSNPHGWGMGHVRDGTTACHRQVGPASESAAYREEALKLSGTMIFAHVRRATVGTPEQANTHPFRVGRSMLIHNGHVPGFRAVEPTLCDALTPEQRAAIRGTTDSEHVFALLRAYRDEAPCAPLHDVTRRAVQQVTAWSRDAPDDAIDPLPPEVAGDHDPREVALNLLWTDGTAFGGARMHRTLFVTTRDAPRVCPVCGTAHADPPAGDDYRAVVFASERITDEDWRPVPDESVFSVAPDLTLTTKASPVGERRAAE